jgi:putative ABC transport system permease protein
MFKNYFKIALRNLQRQKLFSAINIVGLAIGITTFMVISFWVQREMSYDEFHENSSRIYRVERELFRDNFYSRWPICGGIYKQTLIDDFPEIENATRLWRRTFSIKDENNYVHNQQLFATDNSIFEIFDFGLEIGEEKTALIEPFSIVLSSENAEKYFGTKNVVGKFLSFEWQGEPVDFKITGILKKIPVNSHIHFDMLMSISSYPQATFNNWRSNYLYTYILTKEGTKAAQLEEKLKLFVEQHLEPAYGDLTAHGDNIHKVLKINLFPITSIHLDPSVNWELEPGGNITSVYVFSSIAILILLIAGMNFMVLSTARANKRAKEVSLRKTIGAYKNQLRFQFLLESIMLTIVALFISLLLLIVFIPIYNSTFNESLSGLFLLNGSNLLILFLITLFVGLFSGLYPAFYLAKFEPAFILNGGVIKGSNKASFRKTMVIFQFSISIILIVGLLTVYTQMEYIQNKGLGFEKENIVNIPVRSANVREGYESFRNELLTHSKITDVAASADLPGDPLFSNGGVFNRQVSDENINMILIQCDYDYVNTLNMEIIAGRNFSRDISTDTAGTFIINEAAARRIGWNPEEAVGKVLGSGISVGETNVVGVVKNFNIKSLREGIEPIIIVLAPNNISTISVRILPENLSSTLDFIRLKWEYMFPDELYGASFLEDQIEQLYDNENKTQSILIVFSLLSVLIACLGLLGLATYTAEEKRKEIGIRKTLGASTLNVLILLIKEFFIWVAISILVAWPISYFLMYSWLQNFAYHIKLGWTPFVLAASFSLLVTLITVSLQVIKAAIVNPVESLKYE